MEIQTYNLLDFKAKQFYTIKTIPNEFWSVC